MTAQKHIYIKGARVNNLKNVDVKLPRKKLVLITGVSGSGKSSLAFDTLYAEGQRRYVESLSSYARQFMARMEKPDVDFIQGISPAMAIEQRTASSNPRSTVGTLTEIYDFLKLLYARIGKTYSPVSGELVTRDRVSDVVRSIIEREEGSRIHILTRVNVRSQGYRKELEVTLQKGFSRIWSEANGVEDIEDLLETELDEKQESFYLLVDRFVLRDKGEDDTRFRISDSVQTAYQEGFQSCQVIINDDPIREYNEKFERDGIEFEVPSVNLFSFNNPYGACRTCEGFGRVLGIDEDLVIPNKTLSVYDGAVAAWKGEVMKEYYLDFLKEAEQEGFPIHRPFMDLSEEEQEQVRTGVGRAWGYRKFFEYIKSKTHKIQYRVMLSRYRGYTTCPDCKGSRLRRDAANVKIDGHSIQSMLFIELTELNEVINSLTLDENEQKIARRILTEVQNRLDYLLRVGVGYLTLHRKINTLSGGEMQRIKLATSLGSGLVGAMYILDEPSIGLHPRDTDMLISILESLRDKGNSVIVVEHDEAIIRRADEIVDIGPGAGELGGEVVFQGDLDALIASDSLTALYMTGRDEVAKPEVRRPKVNSIQLIGAREHNLKGVDIDVPLHAMTVVTGVSGSGKSTLVRKILYPALKRRLDDFGEKPGFFQELSGDIDQLKGVEMVDQSPIGRSARSNPVTYIKAWDHIRELYYSQQLAKLRGMKPGHFSFNVDGGRCEVCKGDGTVTIEMQFLPDITLTCETCKGKRFKRQVLDINYNGKNVDDVLNMTISEACDFFQDQAKIRKKLDVLKKVGLGYLRMGQSSSTLSGGEAQRVKLAFFLTQGSSAKDVLYIFDEPTTGLHFDDIKKLLFAIDQLVERGNTVLIVEHNLEVIKCADWLIDLGPEGGDQGGSLVYQGVPEGIVGLAGSYTAKYLAEKL